MNVVNRPQLLATNKMYIKIKTYIDYINATLNDPISRIRHTIKWNKASLS